MQYSHTSNTPVR